MSKAVTTQLIALILFVIVLAFIIVFLGSKIFPNTNIDFIFSWFTSGTTGNTPIAPEAIVLQNAIKCSYYRCVNGCNSEEVKRLKYSEEGSFFDCSEFCKPEFTDTKTPEGKICDDRAKSNPVLARVGSSDGEKITFEKLNFAKCIVKVAGCDISSAASKIIFLEKCSIKENTETNSMCGQIHGVGINAVIIEPKSYKIWTSSPDFLGNGGSTFVCVS